MTKQIKIFRTRKYPELQKKVNAWRKKIRHDTRNNAEMVYCNIDEYHESCIMILEYEKEFDLEE